MLIPQVPSPDFTITFVLDYSITALKTFWSSAQINLPKNSLAFTIWYLNNTLANGTNLHKWELSLSPRCSSCLQFHSLLHIVAGCKSYLEDARCIWRHKSALYFIASVLHSIKNSTPFVVLWSFLSRYIITGDHLESDMLLSIGLPIIYVIELAV